MPAQARLHTTSRQPAVLAFADKLRTGAPFWWRAALLGFLVFAGFSILGFADGRTINGANVWDKPAKFMLSFVVHVLTFAWAFSLMPAAERQSALNRRLSTAFVIVFALEIAYIAFRASQGELSHFNRETPVANILFALMGIGAITLTAITATFGYRLLRTRKDLLAQAAGMGLMLGAVLGTLAGAYLSAQNGHWVGGDHSDALGLPLFGWSTSGGDLRVAHFVGLHTIQAIPLAVWLWPHRLTLWVSSAAMILLTLAAFLQARAGIPLFAA
jgi:hypothetical protein